MPDLDIQKFDPTAAELQKLADAARAVVVTDFTDKAQLEAVSEARKGLKQARVRITNRGKELRADAIKFQKDVIAKEQELVAIIEPEEERLSQIEKDIELAQEKERNKLLLPARLARLTALDPELKFDDDALNAMSIPQFEEFFTKQQQLKNERVAAKLAEDQAKVDAEAKRQADEKAAREREERARADERDRIAREERERIKKIEDDAKAEADRIVREAKEKADAEEKARADEAKKKADAEARAKAEKEKQEREIEYQTWFRGLTTDKNATYLTERKDDGTVLLYKLLGTFTSKK